MSAMHVLGIGEVVLDVVRRFAMYPGEGEKVYSSEVKHSIGGTVSPALMLLARLGASCTLVASVGNDTEAEMITEVLNDDGVRLMRERSVKTKVNQVLVNEQSGSRTVLKDVVRPTLIDRIDENLLQQANIVLFDRYEPKAFAWVMARKRPETRVIIDPSTEVSELTLRMCAEAEYPVVPIEFLDRVSVGRLCRVARKPVVVTEGSKGCSVYEAGRRRLHVPACVVKVMDTLGAGDVFRGAFAYAVLREWELLECVRFGNAVAALQCTRMGNGTALPSRAEVWRFWHGRGNK